MSGHFDIVDYFADNLALQLARLQSSNIKCFQTIFKIALDSITNLLPFICDESRK